jgi:hypothetical protein
MISSTSSSKCDWSRLHCKTILLLAWRTESLVSAFLHVLNIKVDSRSNVMAHGDAMDGKKRGKWRMEWVVSTLHTISEHGVSSITTADAHTSVASSRLNWRSRRFKWIRPFRRKTKTGFWVCAITFQTQSNTLKFLVTWVLNNLTPQEFIS